MNARSNNSGLLRAAQLEKENKAYWAKQPITNNNPVYGRDPNPDTGRLPIQDQVRAPGGAWIGAGWDSEQEAITSNDPLDDLKNSAGGFYQPGVGGGKSVSGPYRGLTYYSPDAPTSAADKKMGLSGGFLDYPYQGYKLDGTVGGAEKRDKMYQMEVNKGDYRSVNRDNVYDPNDTYAPFDMAPARYSTGIPQGDGSVNYGPTSPEFASNLIRDFRRQNFDRHGNLQLPDTSLGYMNEQARSDALGSYAQDLVGQEFSQQFNGAPLLRTISDGEGNVHTYELNGTSGNDAYDQIYLQRARDELNGMSDSQLSAKYDATMADVMMRALGGEESEFGRRIQDLLLQERDKIERNNNNAYVARGSQSQAPSVLPPDDEDDFLDFYEKQMEESEARLKDAFDSRVKMIEGRREQGLKENSDMINRRMQQELDRLSATGQFNTDATGELTLASQQLESSVRARYAKMLQDHNMQVDGYFDNMINQAEAEYYDKTDQMFQDYNEKVMTYRANQKDSAAQYNEMQEASRLKREEAQWERQLDELYGDDIEPADKTQIIKDFTEIRKWSPEEIRANENHIMNLYEILNGRPAPAEYAEEMARARELEMKGDSELNEMRYGDSGGGEEDPSITLSSEGRAWMMDPANAIDLKEINLKIRDPEQKISAYNDFGRAYASYGNNLPVEEKQSFREKWGFLWGDRGSTSEAAPSYESAPVDYGDLSNIDQSDAEDLFNLE